MKLYNVCDYVTERIDSQFLTTYNYISTENMLPNKEGITYANNIPKGNVIAYNKGDILISNIRPYFKKIWQANINGGCSSDVLCIRAKSTVSSKFLFYLLSQQSFFDYVMSGSKGCKMPRGDKQQIMQWDIELPTLEEQTAIANILSSLDDKIELNRHINENLEQHAQVLFNNMFGSQIDNLTETPYCLGDLINCIDNRGKTPMLSLKKTKFTIIDVKALSGKSRIINYENCTKYVSKETYNTWFRSGHPMPWDILMSTVGSLAELKIFLGTKGCIAQNVIGLRAKNISALYLYQYLLYVKEKLLTYNIGSVQPSIKVTHIIRYPIFVPSEDELRKFDEVAKHITNQIYTLNEQIIYLSNLRDTLLPKLMSGELKLSEIETKLNE